MKAVGIFLTLASLVAVAQQPVERTSGQDGAPITQKNAVPLSAAITKLGNATSAPVFVEAKVDKICEVKGCWLGLVSDQGNARVTFKDYAFFVPKSLVGKQVLVEGMLEKITMSMEETKHYVQDAGGDPSKVTTPRTEYRIVATGVQVKS